MERTDAETIARMLDEVIRNRRGAGLFPSGVPTNLALIWINEISKLEDASIATLVVAELYVGGDSERLPTPADFKSVYRAIVDSKKPVVKEIETTFAREYPAWVKGWCVARFRHKDWRTWPQQKPGYDRQQTEHPSTRAHVWPDQEMMPPDMQAQYEQEGAFLRAADVMKLVGAV